MKVEVKKVVIVALLMGVIYTKTFSQAKRKTPVKSQLVKKESPVMGNEPWMSLLSKEKLVEITTDSGVMIARLYDSTPLHRDNFVKLVNQKFYDSLLFHRVIDQFMLQGGDPTSKVAPDGAVLGSGYVSGDKIPAEFNPNLFHKKGVLAAARDNNPEKASSNCQFYIVHGKKINEQELENIYNQRVKPSNPLFIYTKSQKEIYSRIGGTPFLDQNYTVFGEVISGLDVIDKIAKAPKDASDRPLKNIRMKIRLLN